MDSQHDPRLLRLDPEDNVLVAIRTIEAGERLLIGDVHVAVQQAIPLGYKVAARPLRAGEKIVKYRAAIGSATRDIAAGEVVHLDNLKSDYLPTFTREEGRHHG